MMLTMLMISSVFEQCGEHHAMQDNDQRQEQYLLIANCHIIFVLVWWNIQGSKGSKGSNYINIKIFISNIFAFSGREGRLARSQGLYVYSREC